MSAQGRVQRRRRAGGVEVQVIEFAACLLLVLWRALDLAGADVALGRDTGDGLGVLRL
jgi:hypothetical protein